MISEIDVLRLRAESAEGGWRMAADEIERLQRENAELQRLRSDDYCTIEKYRLERDELEAKLAAAEADTKRFKRVARDLCVLSLAEFDRISYQIKADPSVIALIKRTKICIEEAAIDAAKTEAKA